MSRIVAIVGRPNVGKSRLFNRLTRSRISIVHDQPGVTRDVVSAEVAEGAYTLLDTGGLGLKGGDSPVELTRASERQVDFAIEAAELILFVVDGLEGFTALDVQIATRLRRGKKQVLLVVNKVDLYKDKEELLPHLQWLSSQLDFMQIVPLSAEKGTNVQELRALVQKQLPPCEFFFPEEYVTDRSSRFMASEIVREKLMRFLGDELPYAVTVEIERFKWEEKHYHIAALVLVERDTQMQMVIGKKGERIKTIATEARKDMETLFEQPVFLQVWVKVKSGWADDERALRSLGYGED